MRLFIAVSGHAQNMLTFNIPLLFCDFESWIFEKVKQTLKAYIPRFCPKQFKINIRTWFLLNIGQWH